MNEVLKVCLQRLLPIISYLLFPFLEINYYFASKIYPTSDNVTLRIFYSRYLIKGLHFYEANVYLIFILMVGVFLICSRGGFGLTRYVRFNVIQASLLDIICSCAGQIYYLLPLVIKEGNIGNVIVFFLYEGSMALIIYAIVQLIFGRYPLIPILSDAAKLQVQRGYSDDY